MPSTQSDRRLHPVALLLGVVEQFKRTFFIFIGGIFAAGGDREISGIPFDAALMGVLTLVLLVVPSVLHYLTYRYSLGPSDLVIRSGLFFRTERHIPYQRIQSLDAKAGVVHRMVGAVAVSIETGGGAEAEGDISAISRTAFEELRHQVLLRDAGAASTADSSAPAAETLARLSPGEALLAGVILGREMLLIGGAFALVYEMGLGDRIIASWFGDDSLLPGSVVGMLRAAEVGTLTPRGIAAAVVLLLSFVVLVRLVAATVTALKYWDHRLERIDDDLRVSCGALSRSTSTTPIGRIQSLTVREGPWHRLAGRVTVQVATAGGIQFQAAVASRETLAPLLRRDQLADLVAIALRGVVVPTTGWQRAAPAAPGRLLLQRFVFWSLVAGVAWWWHWLAGSVAIVLALWSTTAAFANVVSFRWLAFDDGVALRKGWIWRRTTVVRDDRLQLAMLIESPFDRRYQMASVELDTAGSAAPRMNFRWLTTEAARRFAARIDHAVATTPFRL